MFHFLNKNKNLHNIQPPSEPFCSTLPRKYRKITEQIPSTLTMQAISAAVLEVWLLRTFNPLWSKNHVNPLMLLKETL